jgi:hypothetical protein
MSRSNVRNKLNVAHFNGCLIVATIIGGIAESWLVFALAMAAFLIGDLLAGNIRMTKWGRGR